MNQELEKAAKFLEGTAADYDQMAAQLQKSARTPADGMRLYHYKAAAQLLRGQAAHIRGLK